MILSLHIKLARTILGITQEQTAEGSGVSLPTIKNMESSSPNENLKNNKSTLIALVKFFEDEGVEFINEENSVGVKVGKKIIKQKFN